MLTLHATCIRAVAESPRLMVVMDCIWLTGYVLDRAMGVVDAGCMILTHHVLHAPTERTMTYLDLAMVWGAIWC